MLFIIPKNVFNSIWTIVNYFKNNKRNEKIEDISKEIINIEEPIEKKNSKNVRQSYLIENNYNLNKFIKYENYTN
jgi:hypothetical protein